MLDDKPDCDHRGEAGEHVVRVALVAGPEDVPAETDAARACAAHEFGRDRARHANAQPSFRPARIEGGAAGIRIATT
ncbi:hypothetical protein G9462_07765 [Burkholderia thailandensis]|nr:hypothetical protein G9462_07765 [Burkholderia thailandensis]